MKSRTSWLEKFFSPDRRRATRRESPRLIAYYWDGGAPKAHEIRDISPCGLYIKTEERWYPGTLIRITLQQTDSDAGTSERSIAIQAKAVRWGADGVGLAFIPSEPGDGKLERILPDQSADKKALDAFLEKLPTGNHARTAGSIFLIRRLGKRVSAHRPANNEGGSLVEFALCLPMLLLIVTGIFSFGIALNTYLQLNEATSVGARLLAISREQTLDPCATTVAAVYAAAPTLAQSKFTFNFVMNGTPYSGTSCSSSSNTTGAAGSLAQGRGTEAQVTVTYPCNLTVYGKNYAPGCVLTAQTAEIIQ